MNLLDLNIHTTIKRITLKLWQVAFHIKNYVFIIYLLEDEQELSLGMLDTSPTYLQFFIVPCYYIFCLRCLMGFIIHFYINFGTNLLTQGPAQNCCFLPISEFRRKRISNGVQTEWNLRERDFQKKTWSRGLGVDVK